MKNFVLVESNDEIDLILLFKANDKPECKEKWESFYIENKVFRNHEGNFETSNEVKISCASITECTDAEMEVLSKFCAIMYTD